MVALMFFAGVTFGMALLCLGGLVLDVRDVFFSETHDAARSDTQAREQG